MSGGPPERIAVVGGGALGCLYAACLAESGVETWVIDHRRETVLALEGHGVVLAAETERSVPVHAVQDARLAPRSDIVLLLVKGPALGEAAATAAAVVTPNGWVTALQNGFGHGEEVARRVPRRQVLHGVTYAGAVRLAPGRIEPTGWGPTVFGPLDDSPLDELDRVRQLLANAGLDPQVTGDPVRAIWDKSIIACALNAATALLRCRLGGLDTEPGRALVSALLEEALALARAEHLLLDEDQVRQTAARLIRERASTLPSMLQDVLTGRRTEIESLNGYVAARSGEHGLEAPWNACVAALVRAEEASVASRVDLSPTGPLRYSAHG